VASKSASVGQIGSRVAYAGRVIDVNLDRVRFPDGSEGELEMIRHPGAAAVLPLYRAGEWSGGTGPGVVLLRQYRYAAGGYVWEVPAGKLASGEAPEHCARRELEEEAGLQAREMRRLTGIFTTPGFTDEVIHLFLALGLVPGQVAHEDSEFIECRTVALSEALGMIRDGRISDSKTICTLLFAASFEPELDGPLHGR
jgi:ADP-ribose pyrophosphatase